MNQRNEDLFGQPTSADVSLQDQIIAVQREITYREHVYPRLVEAGDMTEDLAFRELLRMRAVLATLERVQQDPSRA